MSYWMFLTALLGLFSVNQATLTNCEELTKPLILEDENKSIMGKWIFIEGVADHHLFTNILKSVSSSWIEIGPSTLENTENTVTLREHKKLSGKCEFQTLNPTVKNSTLYTFANDASTEGKFLPSCHDCVTINFITQATNLTIRSLYLYKRESNTNEIDMDMYWKQAECLGFRKERQYSYDGVTEHCSHVAKDGSSDQKNLDISDHCTMSYWMFLTALLGLFSVNQATLTNCEELTKPLILEDENKSIMGKWIFIEGVADHHLFTNILKSVSSSWIEIGHSTLENTENTVTLREHKKLSGKCEFQTLNPTVKNSTLYTFANDASTEGKFLPSCHDCVTINFITQATNLTIRSLYLYKRESNTNEIDMDMYWKQAECLGFRKERQYSYDGVTEHCSHVAKDDSSDHISDQ